MKLTVLFFQLKSYTRSFIQSILVEQYNNTEFFSLEEEKEILQTLDPNAITLLFLELSTSKNFESVLSPIKGSDFKSLKIILVYSDKELPFDFHSYKSQGIDFLLEKPFEPNQLTEYIQSNFSPEQEPGIGQVKNHHFNIVDDELLSLINDSSMVKTSKSPDAFTELEAELDPSIKLTEKDARDQDMVPEAHAPETANPTPDKQESKDTSGDEETEEESLTPETEDLSVDANQEKITPDLATAEKEKNTKEGGEDQEYDASEHEDEMSDLLSQILTSPSSLQNRQEDDEEEFEEESSDPLVHAFRESFRERTENSEEKSIEEEEVQTEQDFSVNSEEAPFSESSEESKSSLVQESAEKISPESAPEKIAKKSSEILEDENSKELKNSFESDIEEFEASLQEHPADTKLNEKSFASTEIDKLDTGLDLNVISEIKEIDFNEVEKIINEEKEKESKNPGENQETETPENFYDPEPIQISPLIENEEEQLEGIVSFTDSEEDAKEEQQPEKNSAEELNSNSLETDKEPAIILNDSEEDAKSEQTPEEKFAEGVDADSIDAAQEERKEQSTEIYPGKEEQLEEAMNLTDSGENAKSEQTPDEKFAEDVDADSIDAAQEERKEQSTEIYPGEEEQLEGAVNLTDSEEDAKEEQQPEKDSTEELNSNSLEKDKEPAIILNDSEEETKNTHTPEEIFIGFENEQEKGVEKIEERALKNEEAEILAEIESFKEAEKIEPQEIQEIKNENLAEAPSDQKESDFSEEEEEDRLEPVELLDFSEKESENHQFVKEEKSDIELVLDQEIPSVSGQFFTSSEEQDKFDENENFEEEKSDIELVLDQEIPSVSGQFFTSSEEQDKFDENKNFEEEELSNAFLENADGKNDSFKQSLAQKADEMKEHHLESLGVNENPIAKQAQEIKERYHDLLAGNPPTNKEQQSPSPDAKILHDFDSETEEDIEIEEIPLHQDLFHEDPEEETLWSMDQFDQLKKKNLEVNFQEDPKGISPEVFDVSSGEFREIFKADPETFSETPTLITEEPANQSENKLFRIVSEPSDPRKITKNKDQKLQARLNHISKSVHLLQEEFDQLQKEIDPENS